jgi:hypothetical protein
MAEKKGFTGKLYYDFPTQKCLEVKLPNGKWYRVTPNEFRSYDTERRFGVGDDHQPYDGSVYYYGTNKIAPKENTCKIIYSIQHPRREAVLRPNERHFVDRI